MTPNFLVYDRLQRLQAISVVVRSLREKANLTQEGLAELADIERSYISNIEKGTRSVSVLILWRIAMALASNFLGSSPWPRKPAKGQVTIRLEDSKSPS